MLQNTKLSNFFLPWEANSHPEGFQALTSPMTHTLERRYRSFGVLSSEHFIDCEIIFNNHFRRIVNPKINSRGMDYSGRLILITAAKTRP